MFSMVFLVLLDIVYILVRGPLWFARDIFYIYLIVCNFWSTRNCCIQKWYIYSSFKHNWTCEKNKTHINIQYYPFSLFLYMNSLCDAKMYWWGVTWLLDSLSIFWSSLVLKLHRCPVLVHQSNINLHLVSYLLMVW